ncbi:hypothetical protein [Halobaculum lipolyticum]|uniref:hypothetical protein n=1 Tax=Halobaculum lipolyticum TaxID=3032001 RepID=UPI0036F29A9E
MFDSLCRGAWGGFAGIPGALPTVYEAAGVAAGAFVVLLSVVVRRRHGSRRRRSSLALVASVVVASVVVSAGRLECPHGGTGVVAVGLGTATALLVGWLVMR